jgi:hypothetical protein
LGIDDFMMRSLLEEISGSVSVDNISIVLAGEWKQLEEEKFEIEGIAMTAAKEKKSKVNHSSAFAPKDLNCNHMRVFEGLPSIDFNRGYLYLALFLLFMMEEEPPIHLNAYFFLERLLLI